MYTIMKVVLNVNRTFKVNVYVRPHFLAFGW